MCSSSMIRVVIIMNLLPVIRGASQESKLINELNDFFDIDHNIFLLDSPAHINRFISLRIQAHPIPQSVYVFESVDENITATLTVISSKNTLTIVVLDTSSFDKNFAHLVQLKAIQRIQINMKIGIFFSQFVSMKDLKKLFEWCRNNLIVYIFAASYTNHGRVSGDSLNIFTFNHFGTLEVINVTTSMSYKDFFPSLTPNFHQHQLRIGETFVHIIDTELWQIIFRLMNATFIVDEMEYESYDEYFENGIDVLLSWYAQHHLNDCSVYPMAIDPWLIIVPHALPYSDFSAYLRNLVSDKFFSYSLMTMTLLVSFMTFCRYIEKGKFLFFASVTDILNLLMNDNGYIKYQQLSRVEIFVICPLTFVGFVIVNGILSNLQSYITRPVIQPQIKTIEEIYNSPFPIITWSKHWREILIDDLTSRTKHWNWNDKIIALDEEQYDEHVELFNTSIAFYSDGRNVEFLFRVQKRMNMKRYYNPQLQIAKTLVSYRLNDKFLFFDRFNEITQRLRTAGLLALWVRRQYVLYERTVLAENVEHRGNTEDVDVQIVEFPMFIVYGWILSAIVLVVEILSSKFRFQEMKRFCSEFFSKIQFGSTYFKFRS